MNSFAIPILDHHIAETSNADAAKFQCIICLELIRDIVEISGDKCGNLFCRTCIINAAEKKSACPTCRAPFRVPHDIKTPSAFVIKQIGGLRITCPNNEDDKRDCDWKGCISDFDGKGKHAEQCPIRKVACDKCGQADIPARDLARHETMSCAKRIFDCPRCQSKRVIEQDHDAVCTKFVTVCSDCKQQVARDRVGVHVQLECMSKRVHCPACKKGMAKSKFLAHVGKKAKSRSKTESKNKSSSSCCDSKWTVCDTCQQLMDVRQVAAHVCKQECMCPMCRAFVTADIAAMMQHQMRDCSGMAQMSMQTASLKAAEDESMKLHILIQGKATIEHELRLKVQKLEQQLAQAQQQASSAAVSSVRSTLAASATSTDGGASGSTGGKRVWLPPHEYWKQKRAAQYQQQQQQQQSFAPKSEMMSMSTSTFTERDPPLVFDLSPAPDLQQQQPARPAMSRDMTQSLSSIQAVIHAAGFGAGGGAPPDLQSMHALVYSRSLGHSASNNRTQSQAPAQSQPHHQQTIMCRDKYSGEPRPARIIARSADEQNVKVAFDGFDDNFDEWLYVKDERLLA